MKKKSIKIKGKDFVDYTEMDLRFTGWEHECIIIDRCENHYLIPKSRYNEMKREKRLAKKRKLFIPDGVYGCAGITGIV